jgi:hypothetical protein
MKRATVQTLALACAIASAPSCRDEADPNISEEPDVYAVVGEVHYAGQQCGGDFESIDGTLAEQEAQFFGYCERDGDDLEFVVGTEDRPHANASTDFYLLVRGVAGPPAEGVFDTDGQPRDEATYFTTFEDFLFKSVHEFLVDYDDPSDFTNQEFCNITLFAEPIAGELNPNAEQFDYYVALDCGGLAAEAPTDPTIVLNYLEFEFYFRGC